MYCYPGMTVFISWSGERSKAAARALREWLPLVIHYVDPWMSDRDLSGGERWGVEVSRRLENSDFGVIVLTGDSINAPWILFEAGALSKAFGFAAGAQAFLIDRDLVGEISSHLHLTVDHYSHTWCLLDHAGQAVDYIDSQYWVSKIRETPELNAFQLKLLGVGSGSAQPIGS
jgi:hypothetical protein